MRGKCRFSTSDPDKGKLGSAPEHSPTPGEPAQGVGAAPRAPASNSAGSVAVGRRLPVRDDLVHISSTATRPGGCVPRACP